MTAQQDNNPALAVGCPRCHSEVVGGTQFCRSCGFRLFEAGAMAPNYAAAGMAPNNNWTAAKVKKSGPHWLIWVVVGLIIASVVGGGILSSGVRNIRSTIAGKKSKPSSYLGIDETTSAYGGAMIDAIETPDGAADKAGLIGGDVITSLDGVPIRSSDDFTALMSKMPAGKTVDVVYVRDGVTKTTKLTTMSEDQIDQLTEAFNGRKHGFFGVEGFDRVEVSGQSIYGVRVNEVRRNRPAYISGLREGDIVTEFDGIPIRTADEFVARVNRAIPDSVVKLVVFRGTEKKEIRVTVGLDD